MHIVIAPDAFKGCLTAEQVADHMAQGVRLACPNARVTAAPMADGGEGTVEALMAATGARAIVCTVQDAQGNPTQATYGVLPDVLQSCTQATYGVLTDVPQGFVQVTCDVLPDAPQGPAQAQGVPRGGTALMEMAACNALTAVPGHARNPLRLSTYGTGQMMAHALALGVRKICIGIGGSATTDGGVGMAQALGIRFLDKDGNQLPPQPEAWGKALHAIDETNAHPALRDCVITVLCDVKNPLCGPEGAAHVFGPQKGATPEQVAELDAALARLARVAGQGAGGGPCAAQPAPHVNAAQPKPEAGCLAGTAQQEVGELSVATQSGAGADGFFDSFRPGADAGELSGATQPGADVDGFSDAAHSGTVAGEFAYATQPGAGAAGGLGFGLMRFCGARLTGGIEAVMALTQLEEKIAEADLVLTGEGRTDAQTLQGKVAFGVAACAQRHGVPVVVLSGALGQGWQGLLEHGVTACFSILQAPMDLPQAIEKTPQALADAARNVTRLLMEK